MGWYQRMKFPAFINQIHRKSHFSSHSIRGSLLLNYGLLKQNHDYQFLQNGSKRFYSVDKPKVDSIIPPSFQDTFNPCWETIPFIKRKHLVILSRKFEESVSQENVTENEYIEGKIVDASDPVSVRIQGIGKNIINSLEKELSKEQVSDDSSRLNWEFVVVRNPKNNVYCTLGGKILVCTGFLDQCTSDAEIASTIAHEVGHVVARHIAEDLTNCLGLVLMSLVLYPFVTYEYFSVVLIPTFLLRQHLLRRTEFEADYIGMMLMASAGYDPKAAITFWEKDAEQESWLDQLERSLISTHPPFTKRARMLAEVMDEALLRFRGSPARKGVEGGR